MIKYAKTFAKFGVPNNIPLEDKFFCRQNFAIVADGITRDSFGCHNLNESSKEDIFANYPDPSPATKAAEVVCQTFERQSNIQDLRQIMCAANSEVEKLNENLECDYLENDYAGCVAACAYIANNTLFYSYICDCGIIVWDKNGNIRFKTSDDKLLVDPYIDKALEDTPWYLPEGRVIVRRDFRNNPENVQDGRCVSYGAFTGEKEAEKFIKTGTLPLNTGDTVAIFSDGFSPYFELQDFYENLGDLDNYIKAMEMKKGFGREKTIVVMSLD